MADNFPLELLLVPSRAGSTATKPRPPLEIADDLDLLDRAVELEVGVRIGGCGRDREARV